MFLTLEDPRARVKGSRDPLGVLPIWAAFGRHVVTNLTTVTTSVRGFTVLLLGRYWAERLIEEGALGEADVLPVFLRMEQIAAYVRRVAHGVDDDIRGIERVERNLQEHGTRVPIGDDAAAMILSDQKTYGLWGLYTVTARTSGLLREGLLGLTPRARSFVERCYLPHLHGAIPALRRLLIGGGALHVDKRDPLFRAMAALLPERFSPDEQAFYGPTLRDGEMVPGAAPGRQARFVRLLLRRTRLDQPTGRAEVLDLAEVARGEDPALADRLVRIARLEAFLAPAEALFGFLQARHGRTPEDLERELRDHWGSGLPHLDAIAFQEIFPEIRAVVGDEMGLAIARSHDGLLQGDYSGAVRSMLDWNALVMARREAAPWISEREGRLDVRYRGVETELPSRDALPALWRNSYFIDSLKRVASALEHRGA